MQQGYNLMTEDYNKEHYADDNFVEKISLIQFLKMLNEGTKRIDTQIEVYGLEEFLYFTGKEKGIRILRKYLDKGINYLTSNFAFIKIITKKRISIWNGKPVIRYKNKEYPLTNIFGTSLRQKETEYWVANLNINS